MGGSCHVAMPANPGHELRQGVPGPILALILKLLAKTAEELYKTAPVWRLILKMLCRMESRASRRLSR